ncbi:MAG: hypothetical protein GY696_33755 [Gammaproteobacteria bacterium]|nr:hypothetical protein [Gammaproteobacteria bacterium]
MKTEKNSDQDEAKTVERADRRAFLRRSAYAAYMTPAMLSLVVSKNSAADGSGSISVSVSVSLDSFGGFGNF